MGFRMSAGLHALPELETPPPAIARPRISIFALAFPPVDECHAGRLQQPIQHFSRQPKSRLIPQSRRSSVKKFGTAKKAYT